MLAVGEGGAPGAVLDVVRPEVRHAAVSPDGKHTAFLDITSATGEGRGLDGDGLSAARSSWSVMHSFYTVMLGWPVTVEDDEIVLECGGVVEAVAMPVGLAGEVNNLLTLHSLRAPVVELRGERTVWAFLTPAGPPADSAPRLRALARHHVMDLHGTRVPLPADFDHDHGGSRWIVPPWTSWPHVAPEFARWGTLISCTRTASSR